MQLGLEFVSIFNVQDSIYTICESIKIDDVVIMILSDKVIRDEENGRTNVVFTHYTIIGQIDCDVDDFIKAELDPRQLVQYGFITLKQLKELKDEKIQRRISWLKKSYNQNMNAAMLCLRELKSLGVDTKEVKKELREKLRCKEF